MLPLRAYWELPYENRSVCLSLYLSQSLSMFLSSFFTFNPASLYLAWLIFLFSVSNRVHFRLVPIGNRIVYWRLKGWLTIVFSYADIKAILSNILSEIRCYKNNLYCPTVHLEMFLVERHVRLLNPVNEWWLNFKSFITNQFCCLFSMRCKSSVAHLENSQCVVCTWCVCVWSGEWEREWR